MGKTDHETAFDEFFGPISAEASPNDAPMDCQERILNAGELLRPPSPHSA